MTKENLQKLAETRLEESKVLLDNKYYEGCNYLLGYVIEFALKARICKLLNDIFPEITNYKSHDFTNLIHLAGLRKELEIANIDDAFKSSYTQILKLKVENRYKFINASEESTHKMYKDVELIFNWIKTKW